MCTEGGGDASFQFNVNGKIYKVDSSIPPTTTLLQFLREKVSLSGTKGCCYEGGCGVCTVVATFRDSETGKEKTCTVKSCQTLVYACAGWGIETIERLGDRYRGYHPIQKAMVGFSGTQCGYCSPGFIMSMYGKLKAYGKLTMEEIEKSLDGNLCRCTGYRPILDAFKSFATDAPNELTKKLSDIEDAFQITCPTTGELCKGKCENELSADTCSKTVSIVDLSPKKDVEINSGKQRWIRPLSISGVYNAMQKASANEKIRIVVGNTAQGVYKNDGPFDIYINTTAVEDLYSVAIGKPLVIGANISMHRCINIFKEMAQNYNGYEYLNEFTKHWENVANTAIRNTGCWAGNLMMKNKHKEFPSDLFVTLAVAGATITIGHSADSSISEVSVEELINMDMEKNLIISMKLPPQTEETIIRTYKISPRSVNSHAYVNAAFKFQVDKKDDMKLLSKPTIIFGGINPHFVHAKETEEFLDTRRLSIEAIIESAIRRIGTDVVPDSRPVDSSPDYRVSLCQALFYKAVLNILGDKVSPALRSGGNLIQRSVSSGKQTYDANEDTWPVGKPIPKVESVIQVSGEAEYVDDSAPSHGELYGAFVQAALGPAELSSVDPAEALKVDGVVAFIDAKDIPGENSFFLSAVPDPIFVDKEIHYAGQSVGLVVAERKDIAERAAKLVKVEYKNAKKPILTFKDAMKLEEENEEATETEPGPNILDGTLEQGSQFHLQLEPLACRVIPMEDGYDVFCTTQWPNMTQAVVANALGIKNNSINMSVRRLGGGFGGKISRQNVVACATAVAAHKLQKPVRVALNLNTHMTLVGWRDPYLTKYQVTFDDEGYLKRVGLRLFSDAGANSNEATSSVSKKSAPNVYYSVKWGFLTHSVNTDTAPNTYCRAPATPNAIASMENVIERVAHHLKKDPAEIREKNFINKDAGQSQYYSPKGENLVRTKIFPMLKETSSYVARRQEIQAFNKANRWVKRGISMVPIYYGLNYPKSFRYCTQVAIYANDGTVVLSHGGIEMGQGLNTKAVQAAAKILKVPVDLIKVKPTNNVVGANSIVTGGSFGSDLVTYGIQKSCEKLRARIDVIEKKLEERMKQKPSWPRLVEACLQYDVDLSERYWTAGNEHPESYDIFAAVCMEVEVDVLTGQYVMKRTDLIEDCGRSISPLVDVGQVEGGFIMGLGLYTSEEVKYDPTTGQKLTNGTWDYNPPTALDIPTDLRITLLPKADNKKGVLRSKATGEPSVCLTYVVVTALRDAIKSAREDAGNTNWFEMPTPMTVEKVQKLCLVDPAHMVLKMREAREREFEDFDIIDGKNVPSVDEASCTMN